MKNLFLIRGEDEKWYIYRTKNAGLFFLLPLLVIFLFPILSGVVPESDGWNWFVVIVLVGLTFMISTGPFLSFITKSIAAFFQKKAILQRRISWFNYEVKIEK